MPSTSSGHGTAGEHPTRQNSPPPVSIENAPGFTFQLVISLYQESQDVSIRLGLLDQSSSQVVCTSPFTEFTNVLTVQGDGLSSNLVEFVTSQHNLGSIHSRREDSELGLGSHLQAGSTGSGGTGSGHRSTGSLGNDKGRSTSGRNAETLNCRNHNGKKDGESLVCLHDGYLLYCVVFGLLCVSRSEPETHYGSVISSCLILRNA